MLNHCGYDALPYQFTNAYRNVMLTAFYFVAGYLIHTDQGFAKFTLHKAIRLLPPYFVANFLWLIVMAIFQWDPTMSFSLDYIANVFLDPANLPTWFLWSIFFTYILFYALIRLSAHRHPVTMLIFVIAITLAGWYIIINFRLSHSYFWHELMRLHLPISMITLPFAYLGYILSRLNFLAVKPRPIAATLIITFGLFICYVCSPNDVSLYHIAFGNYILLYYIAGIAGTIGLLTLCRIVEHIPIVSQFGRSSLLALCFHYPVICILQNAGITSMLPLFITTTAITTIAILICDKIDLRHKISHFFSPKSKKQSEKFV